MNRYKILDSLYYRIDDFQKFFERQASKYDKTIYFQFPVFMHDNIRYLKCSVGDRLVRLALEQLKQSANDSSDLMIDGAFEREQDKEVSALLKDLYESMSIIWSQYIVLGEQLTSIVIRAENYAALYTAKLCFEDRDIDVTITPEEIMSMTKSTQERIFNDYKAIQRPVTAVLDEVKVARRLSDKLKNLDDDDGLDEEGFMFVDACILQLEEVETFIGEAPATIFSLIDMDEEGNDLRGQ